MPKGDKLRFLTEEEKKNKPKISIKLIKRISGYLRPYSMQMLLVIVAIILSSALTLLPAILTGRIIDDGLIGGNLNLLFTLIAVSFSVLLLSNLINLIQSYLSVWIAHHITFDIRNQLYAHMQAMSHRFFSGSKHGEIITRTTSDVEGIQKVIAETLTNIIKNISLVILAVIAMYRGNWILATIGVLVIPLFILPTKTVGRKRWEITREAQQKNDDMNQILSETLSVSGQMLSKLFTNEKIEYEKYRALNKDMTKLVIKENMAGKWFKLVVEVFTSIGPMLIYLVGGLLILRYGNNDLSVGDITVIVALLGRMYQPVTSLLSVQVEIIRSMALFTRLFEYFDMPVEIKNAPDAKRISNLDGRLTFENVSFRYEPDTQILNGVSFHIPSGSMVALVGPSGAGKSTITNLITRLYDVTGGTITLDDEDIRKLDLNFLRGSIGVVTQETYLFNGTIRENLLYANLNSTQESLIKACREANIHDFIVSLPDGYDTIVGNRGMKLSGGEKQRVSIARAILKNPKVLILDEATSSLDSISESLIQDAIAPLLAGRTSLVIAHRLSTIMSADEILVVQDGKIVEQGNHRRLLARNGVYSELYETQFRKAIDDYTEHQIH